MLKPSQSNISAADISKWEAALRDLSPPCVDPKTGSLMIGGCYKINGTLAPVPFAHANKHFSHLFSIFPLGLLDWSKPDDRRLWTKSLGLFAHYNDPTVSAEGFTYLGMSLITMAAKPSLPGGAEKHWADFALGNITEHFFGVPQLGAGTMYADHASCGKVAGCRAGMAGACNESPLMASLALQHMLLQSWNSQPIAVFPSIPSAWINASFSNMRAEGAVLVSALREGAETVWIELNATKGGSVKVHSAITDLVAAAGSALQPVPDTGGAAGVYMLAGGKGAKPWHVLLYSNSCGAPSAEQLALRPQATPGWPSNQWGSRAMPAPPPPPPGPLPPPALCPAAGCPNCGGCHWPYKNNTEPSPGRPFASAKAHASIVECEDACKIAKPKCVGFTFRQATCWLYDRISGVFASRKGVSFHWRPTD